MAQFYNGLDMDREFDWNVFSEKFRTQLEKNKQEGLHPQTQPEIANIVGCSTGTINRWLNPAQKMSRKNPPKIAEINALAKALRVDFEYLWFSDITDPHHNFTLDRKIENEFSEKYEYIIKFLSIGKYQIDFNATSGMVEITDPDGSDMMIDRFTWQMFVEKSFANMEYELLNCFHIFKSSHK